MSSGYAVLTVADSMTNALLAAAVLPGAAQSDMIVMQSLVRVPLLEDDICVKFDGKVQHAQVVGLVQLAA